MLPSVVRVLTLNIVVLHQCCVGVCFRFGCVQMDGWVFRVIRFEVCVLCQFLDLTLRGVVVPDFVVEFEFLDFRFYTF